jgi:hypothetical protein
MYMFPALQRMKNNAPATKVKLRLIYSQLVSQQILNMGQQKWAGITHSTWVNVSGFVRVNVSH